jgi:F1F0 ATPase subunit 2
MEEDPSGMTGVSIASAAALVGLAVGLVYFAALRRTVGLYTKGRSGFTVIASALGRIAGAIAFFSVTARLGALPLLSSFLGFLLARTRLHCV